MRTKLYLLFLVAFWFGCKPSFKEISDADIEYIEDLNTWRYKSDASTIKENFVCNDAKYDYDGISFTFKRVVTVDEEGHMLTLKQYKDDKIIREGDYKKAPNEYIETIYPEHPAAMPMYKDQNKIYKECFSKTPNGTTIFYKDRYDNIEAEVLYNKEGEIEKIYEWRNGKRVIPMSDLFEIENIKTGYILHYNLDMRPAIHFKLRNKTGHTITSSIELNYKFILDDEIIYSSSKFVNSDAGWENNLVKSIEIDSYEGIDIVKFNKESPKVIVVITFDDDGSELYRGTIATTPI